jgi:hypothetical protein
MSFMCAFIHSFIDFDVTRRTHIDFDHLGSSRTSHGHDKFDVLAKMLAKAGRLALANAQRHGTGDVGGTIRATGRLSPLLPPIT